MSPLRALALSLLLIGCGLAACVGAVLLYPTEAPILPPGPGEYAVIPLDETDAYVLRLSTHRVADMALAVVDAGACAEGFSFVNDERLRHLRDVDLIARKHAPWLDSPSGCFEAEFYPAGGFIAVTASQHCPPPLTVETY